MSNLYFSFNVLKYSTFSPINLYADLLQIIFTYKVWDNAMTF